MLYGRWRQSIRSVNWHCSESSRPRPACPANFNKIPFPPNIWAKYFLPIQVSGKVPEAGLPSESAIDQDVESADSEESRISLSSWKNVESRMAESDVADNVRRLQEMIQRHRWKNIRNVADERINGVLARVGSAQSTSRIDGYLPCHRQKIKAWPTSIYFSCLGFFGLPWPL